MILPTQNALSSAVPVQPGPSPTQRSSATSMTLPPGLGFPAFQQGDGSGLPQDLNRMLVDLANATRYGGGCGVAAGLSLSSGSGLTVQVSAGIAIGPGGLFYLSADASYVVPSSTTCYLWMTLSGLAHATTTTPPTGAQAYLGMVTASSSAVTAIDNGGVVLVGGGLPLRVTGDAGYPVDAPAFPMVAQTAAGAFAWSGAWAPIGTPTRVATVSTTQSLLSSSANRQALDPGSATVKVLVPASRLPGPPLEIHHAGASGTLQVRNATDTTTLISLTTGQRAVLYPSFAPSGAAYPAATAV